MPLYDFKCIKCSFKFESIINIGEEYPKCPKCCSSVNKIISLCSKPNIEYSNSKEYYEKVIKPDVDETVRKIHNGDEDAYIDIVGEK